MAHYEVSESVHAIIIFLDYLVLSTFGSFFIPTIGSELSAEVLTARMEFHVPTVDVPLTVQDSLQDIVLRIEHRISVLTKRILQWSSRRVDGDLDVLCIELVLGTHLLIGENIILGILSAGLVVVFVAQSPILTVTVVRSSEIHHRSVGCTEVDCTISHVA